MVVVIATDIITGLPTYLKSPLMRYNHPVLVSTTYLTYAERSTQTRAEINRMEGMINLRAPLVESKTKTGQIL